MEGPGWATGSIWSWPGGPGAGGPDPERPGGGAAQDGPAAGGLLVPAHRRLLPLLQPAHPAGLPLAAALREQFLQEQKWRRLCQRAAAEGDSTACGGLYETLDGQAEHRMEAIRCLLEQMQPLPSGG